LKKDLHSTLVEMFGDLRFHDLMAKVHNLYLIFFYHVNQCWQFIGHYATRDHT